MSCIKFMRGCFITAASFFVFCGVMSPLNSYGRLFTGIQNDLNTTAIQTGWIGSVAWAMNYLVSPFALVSENYIGYRQTIVIGAIVSSGCYLLSSYLRSFVGLLVVLGVVNGSAVGLCIHAVFCVLFRYFSSSGRTRASGFAMLGSSFGAVPLSVFYELFVDRYGWRFALQMTAAFAGVLSIPASFLIIPTVGHLNSGQSNEKDTKRDTNNPKATRDGNEAGGVTTRIRNTIGEILVTKKARPKDHQSRGDYARCEEREEQPTPTSRNTVFTGLRNTAPMKLLFSKKAEDGSVQQCDDNNERVDLPKMSSSSDGVGKEEQGDASSQPQKKSRAIGFKALRKSRLGPLYPKSKKTEPKTNIKDKQESSLDDKDDPKEVSTQSSTQKSRGTGFTGLKDTWFGMFSSGEHQPRNEPSQPAQLDDKKKAKTETQDPPSTSNRADGEESNGIGCAERCKSSVQAFSDTRAWLIFFAILFPAMSWSVFWMNSISYFESISISREHILIYVTVATLSDLLGRMSLTVLVTCLSVKESSLLLASNLIIMVVTLAFLLVPEHEVLIVCSVFIGIGRGWYNILPYKTGVDLLEMADSDKGLTIVMFSLGMGFAIGTLPAGAIYDATGSYEYAFIINSILYLVGGSIQLCLQGLRCVRQRREEGTNDEEDPADGIERYEPPVDKIEDIEM